MTEWSANVRRAWYLGLIEGIEARRAREKAQRRTIRERMVAYVLTHPGCTYKQMAKSLRLTIAQLHGARVGLDPRTVRSSTLIARWWADYQNSPVILENADTLIAAELARP